MALKGEALCWGCQNAEDKKCLWVRDLTPVWTRAREVYRKDYRGVMQTIYIVLECAGYEPDA